VINSMRGGSAVSVLLASTLLLFACGSGSTPGRATPAPSPSSAAVTATPGAPGSVSSMILVGHSGATGWNSDPNDPGQDARDNSWGTGANPAVKSIYLRLLPANPPLRDHAVNEAVSGSLVTDLDSQLDRAFAAAPTPDLVLIQTVDNDIRCDGTDGDNYRPFHDTLAAALTKISRQSPRAAILIVSSPWSTVADYAAVAATLPGGRKQFTGTGPCDLFDPSGRPNRAHQRYQQQVIDKYFAQLVDACRQVPTCHDDGGALAHLKIDATDLTPDYNHLSVAGQAKQAALEWKVLRPVLGKPR
jgi:lysophospholipase L1-like esterase